MKFAACEYLVSFLCSECSVLFKRGSLVQLEEFAFLRRQAKAPKNLEIPGPVLADSHVIGAARLTAGQRAPYPKRH